MCSIMAYSQGLELHVFAKAYVASANDINIINIINELYIINKYYFHFPNVFLF